MNNDYIDDVVEKASQHTARSYNEDISQKLIGQLLSIVCYQRGKLEVLDESPKETYRVKPQPPNRQVISG